MDVCIHITADGKEVQFLDLDNGVPSQPKAVEQLDQQLFATTLSADAIRTTAIETDLQLIETGQLLFGALMRGTVLDEWEARLKQRRKLEDAWEQKGNNGPRPILRTYLCTKNPAMAAIPWELLTEASNLFADESSPWVRCEEHEFPKRQDGFQYRVRVFVVNGANPKDKGIMADEESKAVRDALARCEHGFEYTIAPRGLPIPDLEKLIRSYEPHILHFLGHSEFDPIGQPQLMVYDGAGYLPWKSTEVRGFLQTIPTLRLTYLNACRTGVSRQSDQKAARSLAEVFLEKSLAVVAMHHDVRGAAAKECAEHFYNALVDGLHVDQALVRARHTMLTTMQTREPYLPALTVRAEPGQIVVLRPQPEGLDAENFGQEVSKRVTKHFVDHQVARRELHGLFDGPLRDKRAILVTGANGTGKSWLIQWVMHALALRGVRVHYLKNPSGDWLSILRQIRDEGKTKLQQGACSPEEAQQFNWALHFLSQGDDPKPYQGADVPDSGEASTSMVDKKGDLPKKLCAAMLSAMEGSAGEGSVLALDQWDLGSLGQEHPSFKPLFEYLLEPLRKKKTSGVRLILSVSGEPDLTGWYPLKVPEFPKNEISNLAEELFRRLYPNASSDDIKFARSVNTNQPAGRLYESLDTFVRALRMMRNE
jgi:hypothetical protein